MCWLLSGRISHYSRSCLSHGCTPYTLRSLDSLVKQEILAKVTKPIDWVNSLVCVASTSKSRLCLDPNDLNCAIAIKRTHFFTPTLEDILPKLNDAKCLMHPAVIGISSLPRRARC